MPRGVKFTVELDNRRARKALGILERLGVQPAEFLNVVGDVLEASVRNRFDTGRGPGGVPWPPSQRVLHAASPKGPMEGGNGKTLVDKGNLERSLRKEVQPRRVLVGFDGRSESAKNASALQFGSHRQTVVVGHTRTINSAFGVPFAQPRVVKVRPHGRVTNLPARPMLGIDQQDVTDVKDGLRAVLAEKLK